MSHVLPFIHLCTNFELSLQFPYYEPSRSRIPIVHGALYGCAKILLMEAQDIRQNFGTKLLKTSNRATLLLA